MRFLLGWVPVFALLAQSQAAPDARALLMRSGGSVLMADTVRLEGTETTESVSEEGPKGVRRSFSMMRTTGNRMRFESRLGNVVQALQVSDGTNLWNLSPGAGTHSQVSAPTGPANDPFGRLKFSRDPASFHDAKVERQESSEFGGQDVPCYVVSATYNSMPGSHEPNVRRTVWIAQGDDRILRDYWDLHTLRVTTDYTVIEWGVALADDLFVFHPPEGSRLVAGARSSQKPGSRATLLHEVKPEYSPEGRAAGLQGTVSLYVEVRNDGRPGKIQVMQGLGLGLDQRAIEAVKQWVYKMQTGRADGIQSILDAEVQFRLDRPGPWDVVSEAYSVAEPVFRRPKEIAKPVPIGHIAPDSSACRTPGRSALELKVGKDGKPREVKAVRGDGGAWAEAAVKVVKGWRFAPATADGKAVEARGEVELACRPDGMELKSERRPLPVYRVGGGVTAPEQAFKIEPRYSEEARLAKLQGTNRLYVQISPEGKAVAMLVIEPLGMGLDEMAMEAVKRWRFKPAMKDGHPVTVEATIDVNFKLL